MPQWDTVSWNTYLKANAEESDLLDIFEQMPSRDVISWNTGISASTAFFERMPMRNLVSYSAAVRTYAQSGHLHEAKLLFDTMPEIDIVTTNCMLDAYAHSGHLDLAVDLFIAASYRTVITWSILIKSLQHMDDMIRFFNMMPCWDATSWNTILAAYARSGHMHLATETFQSMPFRDSISWSSMIQGYGSNGLSAEARAMLDNMPSHSISSWNALLAANARNGHLMQARETFGNMPHRDVISWNTMIDVDSPSEDVNIARLFFVRAPMWSIASWNSMIAANARRGQDRESLHLAGLMQLEGIRPGTRTLAMLLDSCATLTALSQGRQIHSCIQESHSNAVVLSALITMYGRCSRVDDARNVFDEGIYHIVPWNAMLSAYARNGHFVEAKTLFQSMTLQGLRPDVNTFTALLTMCSHAGLRKQSHMYFVSAEVDFHVGHNVDHFVCVVDLLARSGRLSEAEELVECMPYEPGDVPWLAVLGACTSHSDEMRGQRAAGHASGLQPTSLAPLAILSAGCSRT